MVRRARPKTKYHHGDLRAALMEAASTLLDIRGRDAVSMRAVARRAGVSEAAPYKHFKSLNELLAAIAAEGFDMLQADLELAMSASARKEAWAAFAADYPGRYKLMFETVPDRKQTVARRKAIGGLADTLGSADRLAALHGQAMLAVNGLA